jgi:hypothetical protein
MPDDDAERPLNSRQADHARADLDAIPEACNIQETGGDDIEARGVDLKPLLPKRLYKYRSFNVNSLRLLTEAEIYYSNPRAFNDPLDCNPPIEVDVDRASLEHLCYKMLRDTAVTKEAAEQRINDWRYESTEYGDYRTDPDVDKYLKECVATGIKRVFDGEMAQKGVFSLSQTWRSPLMWSHYADEHRGICLEYDTTQIPHPAIAPVDYGSPRSVKASDLIEWKIKGSAAAERRVHKTYFFCKVSPVAIRKRVA